MWRVSCVERSRGTWRNADETVNKRSNVSQQTNVTAEGELGFPPGKKKRETHSDTKR